MKAPPKTIADLNAEDSMFREASYEHWFVTEYEIGVFTEYSHFITLPEDRMPGQQVGFCNTEDFEFNWTLVNDTDNITPRIRFIGSDGNSAFGLANKSRELVMYKCQINGSNVTRIVDLDGAKDSVNSDLDDTYKAISVINEDLLYFALPNKTHTDFYTYRSSDGLIKLSSLPHFNLIDIHFKGENLGYILFEDKKNYQDKILIRTDDGGDSWNDTLKFTIEGRVYSIWQIKSDLIILSGSNSIIYSENAGKDWQINEYDMQYDECVMDEFQNYYTLIDVGTQRNEIGEDYDIYQLYVSDNLGKTWKYKSETNLIGNEPRIAFHEGGNMLISFETGQVYFSSKYGSGWKKIKNDK